ncbi:hypothetical protein Tco_1011531 [Tanacetum coccineum]
MGTCPSSLSAKRVALMLSVEVVRYIVRASPFIRALLSILKKRRDLSASLDKKLLSAASFSLRLYMSLSVFLCSRKLSCLHLLLPFGSDGNCYTHLESISGETTREILPSSQFWVEVVVFGASFVYVREILSLFFTKTGLATHFCLLTLRSILAFMSSSTSLQAAVLRTHPLLLIA